MDKLPWGKHVNAAFRAKVRDIAKQIGADPAHLMAIMAFESAETFSSSIRNKYSGAVGLIQFMPSTARAMGTSVAALAAMSPTQQLDMVARYFLPYRGRLKTLSDMYMAVLWPAAVGKPETYVLFSRNDSKRAMAYRQNAGLDVDKDGDVDKREATAHVQRKLIKGLLDIHAG